MTTITRLIRSCRADALSATLACEAQEFLDAHGVDCRDVAERFTDLGSFIVPRALRRPYAAEELFTRPTDSREMFACRLVADHQRVEIVHGDYGRIDVAPELARDLIAQGYAITCEDCDIVTLTWRGVYVFGEEHALCDDCQGHRDATACYECGELHALRAMVEHDGSWYCDSCSDSIAPDADCGVLEYDACVLRHRGFVYTDDDGAQIALDYNRQARLPILGVEIETEASNRDAVGRALLGVESFRRVGIVKKDGSVSGPECVVLPATLAAHRQHYDWPAWCAALRDAGARGHTANENIGIHVHIDREAFGDERHVGRVLVFVNALGNRKLMRTIAQRESHYARFVEKTIDDGRVRHAREKFEAVFLRGPTVEFRLFRSNLIPARILKNIEAAHSIFEFCREREDDELGAHDYLAWLAAHRADYPALSEFLARDLGALDAVEAA